MCCRFSHARLLTRPPQILAELTPRPISGCLRFELPWQESTVDRDDANCRSCKRMKRCGNALLLICGCVCQFTNSELRAQPYPAKPVRVVIPATPGSNTDIFFRIIAPKMGAMLGQQVVADYRAGAGGVIGAANTIRSAPDGYTIAMIAGG